MPLAVPVATAAMAALLVTAARRLWRRRRLRWRWLQWYCFPPTAAPAALAATAATAATPATAAQSYRRHGGYAGSGSGGGLTSPAAR